MSIAVRLKKGFDKLTRYLVIVGILAIIGFVANGALAGSFYSQEFVAEQLQLGVRKDIQTVNKRVLLAAATGEQDVIDEQRADFEERFPSMKASITKLGKLVHVDVSDAEAKVDALAEASEQILQTAESKSTEDAVSEYRESFNAVSEELADAFEAAGNKAESMATTKYRAIIISSIVDLAVIVLVGLYSFLNSRKTAAKITADIKKPLDEIKAGAKELELGNIQNAEIAYTANDEIGEVAESLRQAMSQISYYIGDIDRAMKEVSDGELAVSFEQDYIGDFKNIQIPSIISQTTCPTPSGKSGPCPVRSRWVPARSPRQRPSWPRALQTSRMSFRISPIPFPTLRTRSGPTPTTRRP